MENYWLFVFMCIMLIILPGPDTAIITRNTISKRKAAGMKTTFGTLTALLIHTLAAVFGLSALIVKSAFLFSILKYVGAIYLIYLGCKSILYILKKHPQTSQDLNQAEKYKNASYYRQGFLTNLLNPKVAVFFLTFLPQFAGKGDNAFFEFLALGLTYTVLTLLWFIFYIYLINYISEFMKKPSTMKAVEGLTGGILILFGIKLALEKN
ncbi:LysE family translocator [Bacillus sp. DTU_2020_1000418_1_SI_GHA_SEK_038]|uniref:LysE family translocator n=1 Tax=Bacillus sp. DTU_2020_1000418_1_SI_GHA_SEK_038 TaxID=3077585 RepID=UPI0028E86D1C|nr:LysE family translocator [Bacillus sp. DTU_2020_1000418_1_SI_GHA_SEK_038]WNS77254.1 LysE family translocator [Bacillus sp. DTU_2020_1000418_1_SI_GHA_SEK_038]